ncbi:MAG TPA: Ku protein [Caulobacteraceae bacterium]|nr:Ku protein [Caulobacteraceae bacterium]
MSSRPTWQGHLKLSLVSCPVALHAATSSAGDVHFHLINPRTNNRIRMIATDPDDGPVERRDLVKGYEFEKDRYILLSDEEIRSVRLESTRTIDIERFVPAEDIDRLYWNDPYFLLPDGKMAAEAYGVIREAMKKSGQIALGRVVMSTRERLLALEPRGKGIIAYTLRTEDEVDSAEEAFHDIPAAKADPNMVSIALKIIEQKEAPFDPAQFVDRYEEALKALIAEKQEGEKPVAAAAPEDTNVVDLMEALRASLRHDGPKAAPAKPRAKAASSHARRKAR